MPQNLLCITTTIMFVSVTLLWTQCLNETDKVSATEGTTSTALIESGMIQPNKSIPTLTVIPKEVAASNGSLPANELGQILILEYHLIGHPEGQWRRTPENFRKDLSLLYENGYYPISLNQLVDKKMDIPAGKTPFILTFDDSSEGQFRYLVEGNRRIIDPKSAVGMMEQFKKEHPDFPLTATFFVLPAVDPKLRLFAQKEWVQEKFDFLAKNGYDIGNHSYWHQNLGKTDDKGVQKQLALAVEEIQKLIPNYNVRSLALPLGVHAKNRELEYNGVFGNTKYHHDCVLLVGSGPIPSPYSKDFNPQKLERIQAGDTAWGPESYVKKLQKNPSLRYISDGNPNVVAVPKGSEKKLIPSLSVTQP